jgi:hypothetical protein
MRKILTLGPAVPVLLAAALAGCGGAPGGGGPGTAAGGSADRPAATAAPTTARPSTTGVTSAPTTTVPATTSTTGGPPTTEAPSTTTPAPTTTAPTTTVPAPTPGSTGRHFLCPEGGIDAVRELQREVDAGHQPWRLSATDVAAGCTYGLGAATVEPAGAHRYRVTNTSTGERLLVTVAQPLGPGTVWAVTRIAPA